jgi:integrase
VERFNFHDLRHQAATDLLTLGAGLNDVRDFLRHKSMTMTLRYAHLIRERRKATAGLLDRLSTKTATAAGENL